MPLLIVLLNLFLVFCMFKSFTRGGGRQCNEPPPAQPPATGRGAICNNSEIVYLRNRAGELAAMIREARQQEAAAAIKVENITALNEYGVVVNEKNLNRAKNDLYNLQRKRLQLEKLLHQTEKELNKLSGRG